MATFDLTILWTIRAVAIEEAKRPAPQLPTPELDHLNSSCAECAAGLPCRGYAAAYASVAQSSLPIRLPVTRLIAAPPRKPKKVKLPKSTFSRYQLLQRYDQNDAADRRRTKRAYAKTRKREQAKVRAATRALDRLKQRVTERRGRPSRASNSR